MIAHLMFYGLEVATLLGAAAWAIESVAIWRGRPRRACWAAAMALSVAIPLVGIMLAPPNANSTFPPPPPHSQLPASTSLTAPAIAPAARSGPPAIAPARAPASQAPLQPSTPINWEKALGAGWLLASCGLFIGFMFLATRLRLAARRWRREQVAGQEVWVTESLGPAVYGFIDPIVLLPQWLLHAHHNELSVAVAHEKAHLAARDPALLLLGLIVIVILPWNVPLWWQLRRLRFAIEVDCDARVLHRGLTPREYGNALLAIGQRSTVAPFGAMALTEPASQLLRRIQIMTSELPKRSTGAVLTTVLLALACVAIAAETKAPASFRTTAKIELPRRANEPGARFEVFNRALPATPGDDRAVDRLIAERYFPDLYTYPEEWPRADPWILLDAQGKVLTAGRRVVNSAADIQLNIQSLYPGIKTDHLQVVTFQGPHGQRPDLAFVWLAADSPVTNPAQADFSRQPDVLMYADVSHGGTTFYTEMLALKFGSTGTTRCALRNPFGVVYLRVALEKGDANAASVRIRWQHMPLPAGEYIPDPAENSWSAQSTPIRAAYGGSSETQVTDADGKKWDIVLHTDRMTHTAPRPATAPL